MNICILAAQLMINPCILQEFIVGILATCLGKDCFCGAEGRSCSDGVDFSMIYRLQNEKLEKQIFIFGPLNLL